jgi:5'-deoxynucleotidase YfbR-like HD superfamily hydrolase
MLRQQSVGEHSFRVAAIASVLARKLEWDVEANQVVLRALSHDIEEANSGDIPSTYKHHYPALNLNNTDLVVAIADKMETLTWFNNWNRENASNNALRRHNDIYTHIQNLFGAVTRELAARMDKPHKEILELCEQIMEEIE